MPTSGTITQTMSVSELVRMAMGPGALGILAPGESPTAEETQNGAQILSFMLKSFTADGVNLWRETNGTVTFTAGTKTMALSPYCNDVLEARLVQSSTFERPLQRWENGQYLQIPNKASPGYPTAYTLTRTTDVLSMTVWPVPVSTMTVLYSYARAPYDVTDGSQTIDVPTQWLETIYLNLASRMASGIGATRLDPNTVSRVDAMAGTLLTKMLDADRPSSTFMGSAYGRDF